MSDTTALAAASAVTTPAPAAAVPAAAAATQPVAATPSALGDAAAAAKPPDAAGSEFELKFGEGVKLDDASLASFKSVAKELGLDSPKAQKLVDLYGGIAAASAKAQQEAFAKFDADLVAQLKADPDIGGDKLEASKKLAHSALAKFGPDVGKILDAAGLGNHPALVKFFAAVGKGLADDSIGGSSGAAAGGQPSESDVLRKLYPTMHGDA